jgi:hypothetical protein
LQPHTSQKRIGLNLSKQSPTAALANPSSEDLTTIQHRQIPKLAPHPPSLFILITTYPMIQ